LVAVIIGSTKKGFKKVPSENIGSANCACIGDEWKARNIETDLTISVSGAITGTANFERHVYRGVVDGAKVVVAVRIKDGVGRSFDWINTAYIGGIGFELVYASRRSL
ncbi:hypothetical protein, partial [Oleiphilus sp. HI0079]|uniref:hypothetical protein n=1 Tax=Oleiphilus sp. HI0079 TaxID=1822254 RepID=UPI0018D2DAC2